MLFIVGCARTGSTLLRAMLNKSEHICITPETHYLRRMSYVGLWKRLRRFGDLRQERNVVALVDYLYSPAMRDARNYWGWLNRNVSRDELTRRLLASDRTDRAIFSLILQMFAEKKHGDAANELWLGEKTPTHLYYIPTLREWYPNAKIVHTFRDPRGIFVSTLKRVKEGRWGLKAKFPALPNGLVAPLSSPLAALYTTKTWLDAARLHHEYQQRYGDSYHLVRFEDLVTEPEREVRKVCAFLDVPFKPEMLDVIVIGSSYTEQRRGQSGFDTQAINRWQSHIDPSARAWFSLLGGKQLRRFGYVP